MVKQKTRPKIKTNSPNYLEIITPDQGMIILKSLLENHPNLKLEFEKLAINLIESFDIEDIAEDIYSSLDNIDLENVWNQTGSDRSGVYKDSYDVIVETIEDILDPFVRQIKSYIHQNLPELANKHCKGVLKGLHDFESENNSEIFNELVDGLEDIARGEILNLWDKVNFIEETESIERFIRKELPKWEI